MYNLLILICYYYGTSQNPEGGYGGGPGQASIMQNTFGLSVSFYYANLQALCV